MNRAGATFSGLARMLTNLEFMNSIVAVMSLLLAENYLLLTARMK